MAMSGGSSVWTIFLSATSAILCLAWGVHSSEQNATAVITLAASNFSEFVAKHPFVVVDFYAPWCVYSQLLQHEYEKAASIMSKDEPPIVFAKVDADDKVNRELSIRFKIQGYPTIKFLKDGGKIVEDYDGPLDADDLVWYSKKQVGYISSELASADDAARLVQDNLIFIVGVFQEFGGVEYEIFMSVANKLKLDYEFGHTLDAKLLPDGDSNVNKPFIRLFRTFDERTLDLQNFDEDAIQNFIKSNSIPVVTTWDEDPHNGAYVQMFFDSSDAKAMLFLDSNSGDRDVFTSKYREIAQKYKGKNMSFLIGDVNSTQRSAIQSYGLKEDEVPLIIVNDGGQTYYKSNLEVEDIAIWLNEYMEGNLKPFIKPEPLKTVVTLDKSNFSETVANHSFIVVEFYAQWCGHCQRLEPEYEKAASILSKHDPPIVLAKVDADDTINQQLTAKYNVKSYPTIKIVRDGGKNFEQYNGPRDADGIVAYLKRLAGPASTEVTSAEDVAHLIQDNRIFIVGVFHELSGPEFENFISVAENLRSDYAFGHVLDAKLLPHGDSAFDKPYIRMFKPFDDPIADFKNFSEDALKNFVESNSLPTVTTWDEEPSKRGLLEKFFSASNSKSVLLLNFSSAEFDTFKSKYLEIAHQHKGKGMSFLIGDPNSSQNFIQFFGLEQDQAPLIVILSKDGYKYRKTNLEVNDIGSWLNDFMEGRLEPYIKSEPKPEVNDEPVKVVVANTLSDTLFNGKDVLLEFYAPWCGHCKNLAPILNEVALSFKDDSNVIIAKMDATANEIPTNFDVPGYPTIYMATANGQLVKYEGGRTAAEIIDFVNKSRDTLQSDDSEPDPVKDEL